MGLRVSPRNLELMAYTRVSAKQLAAQRKAQQERFELDKAQSRHFRTEYDRVPAWFDQDAADVAARRHYQAAAEKKRERELALFGVQPKAKNTNEWMYFGEGPHDDTFLLSKPNFSQQKEAALKRLAATKAKRAYFAGMAARKAAAKAKLFLKNKQRAKVQKPALNRTFRKLSDMSGAKVPNWYRD